jgi:glutathione S-transferase
MRFVDLATALGAGGLRLVVIGEVPSPWSEAAKGIFRVKGIDAALVRFRVRDPDLMVCTGTHNAPVALFDDEPPRTGWADILALGERLGGAVSLVPAGPARRVRLFGIAHEICGEGGLGWNSRLMMIHHALASDGARGLTPPVARYLAKKYDYHPDGIPAARRRILDLFDMLADELGSGRAAGGPYFFGAAPTALDIYAATFLTPFVGLADGDSALAPDFVHAHVGLVDELGARIPAALREHRTLMFRRHLPGPITL